MRNMFIEQPSRGWRKSRFCGPLNSQLCDWMKCLMCNYWPAKLGLKEEPIVWLIEQPIAWLTEMLNMFIEQPVWGWLKSQLCGSLISQLRSWLKCLMCNFWPANLWLKEEPILLLIEQRIAWLTEMLNVLLLNSQFEADWRANCVAHWSANCVADWNA